MNIKEAQQVAAREIYRSFDRRIADSHDLVALNVKNHNFIGSVPHRGKTVSSPWRSVIDRGITFTVGTIVIDEKPVLNLSALNNCVTCRIFFPKDKYKFFRASPNNIFRLGKL